MDRAFKFRHASELSGILVLVAVVLLVGGISTASRVQGWFEGTFDLRTVFRTEEGAFGLQEGADVMIRNASAGRVGKLEPTAEGFITTTFRIKRRYQSFVGKNSVAVVKRKFGVAGDAYVEITGAKGPPIESGATIECRREEELTEIAKRTLADFQEAAIPLLRDVQGIISNVNRIAAEVAGGRGVVGAAIRDPDLTADVKTAVHSANVLMGDASQTLREVKRLVEGVQRHWLIRSYVKQDAPAPIGLVSVFAEDPKEAEREVRDALKTALRHNNSGEVARQSYSLALILLEQGRREEADRLRSELGVEAAKGAANRVLAQMLEADLAAKDGARAALGPVQLAVGLLDDTCSPELKASCHLRSAQVFVELGRLEEFAATMKEVRSELPEDSSSLFQAEISRLEGLAARRDGRTRDAARYFEAEAALYQAAGGPRAMAVALERAGDAYQIERRYQDAADRFYRSARSLGASGDTEAALRVLAKGAPLARKGDSPDLVAMIAHLEQDLTALRLPKTQ
jgi:hypothetical protein